MLHIVVLSKCANPKKEPSSGLARVAHLLRAEISMANHLLLELSKKRRLKAGLIIAAKHFLQVWMAKHFPPNSCIPIGVVVSKVV